MHDSTKRNLSLLAVLVLLTLGISGCTNSSNSSLPTTPTGTLVTETFSGSVTQGGMAVYPFTVKTDSTTLLAGFTAIAPTSIAGLGMGIGAWDGTTCGLNLSQVNISPVGTTALNGTAAAGNYCIRVYDGGNITDPTMTVTYTFQVQHY